ncbi:glycosyltransferase family 4 protein [Geodermatophilus aquaeductus]|uniref:Glycosyltransferase involved in cell wall bisynthesis n=1 Tax=Geodermatophilus aquaeductus TaxID=1564161 RepID=A0A521CNK5_9ACTN|nr:glycosyltransferase family 4 protein [Geodermatophilus aquaeductus]SMO61029.1 Glycosyltransferase involved in cell wall bisynthesis [Geodermatophilus aquaeductus]
MRRRPLRRWAERAPRGTGLGQTHVLIVVENLPVPFDRRVWQESRALRDAGYRVTVICPMGQREHTEPRVVLEGITVLRYPLRAAEGGPLGYVREYAAALWHTGRLTLQVAARARIDVVQVCNPPDLLFLAVLPLKLRGATFVFDHHDLVPELAESRFDGKARWLRPALLAAERWTFGRADAVLSTNESYRRVAIERGGKRPHEVTVVRSAPDLSRFGRREPMPELRQGRRYLAAYVGVMGPQDGVDHALHALAHYHHVLGRTDLHTVFMGSGDATGDMIRLAEELGLGEYTTFTGRVPDEFLQSALSTADVALSPDPLNPLNDVSTMNKVVEYMAIGVPVVSFDLVEARVSAGDAATYVPPNDVAAFAVAIRDLLEDPARRAEMAQVGRSRVAEELSWDTSRRNFVAAYRALAGPTRSAATHG